MPERKKHKVNIRSLQKENNELRKALADMEEKLKLGLESLHESKSELKILSHAALLSGLLKKENLSNLSHKLRTPLNGIIGMSNLLEDTQLNETQKEYLSFIKEAGYNLLGIINDLIYYLKSENGKNDTELNEINLSLFEEEVKAKLKDKINNFNDLSISFNSDIGIPDNLYGDYYKLLNVLTNLLQFTIDNSDNGSIKVTLKLTEMSEETAEIYFIISDTASKITEEQKDKIFSPFSEPDITRNGRQHGTGLEMAIARSMVRMMGSDISYETSSVKGDAFIFRLRLDVKMVH